MKIIVPPLSIQSKTLFEQFREEIHINKYRTRIKYT